MDKSINIANGSSSLDIGFSFRESAGRFGRLTTAIKLALVIATYLVVVYLFGCSWFKPGLPIGDMGGTVAGLAHWRNLAVDGQLFSTWNSAWFCGHSRALFNLNGGMELAYAPFLLVGEPLAAVKIGGLTYLALAGFSGFVLLNYLVRNKAVAYLMGLAYALHPLHLSVTAGTSHANFPPYYFLQPILIWRMLRLLDKPDGTSIAVLAIVAAITGWVDFERLAVLLPWMGLVIISLLLWRRFERLKSERHSSGSLSRPLKAMVVAALLSLGLLSIFLLPAACEKTAHALFSEQTRSESASFFSIQNPLYYLDRGGVLLSEVYKHLPAANAHDAGTFYLGGVLMLLIVVGFVLPSKNAGENKIFAVYLVAGSLALATAHGSYSGYESLCKIFDKIFLYSLAQREALNQLLYFSLGVAVIVGLLLAIFYRQVSKQKKSSLRALVIATGVVSCILFTRPFVYLLGHFPPFEEMRNPGWFATAMPPVAVVIAAAIGLKSLLGRIGKWPIRWLVLVVVTVLLAWDVWPYRSSFNNLLADEAIAELKSIASVLKEDSREGRVLSRESYNPHSDLLYAYSGRTEGFYWLNWMAPAKISEYMFKQIYPKLHRQETIAEALRFAGWANVRYIIYDLNEGPYPPATDLLIPHFKGSYFALYENTLCKAQVNLLGPEAIDKPDEITTADTSERYGSVEQIKYNGSDEVIITLNADTALTLALSRAWFPGWQAEIDGQTAPVHRVQKAFIGSSVEPGLHTVRFFFHVGWYYYAGVLMAVTSLIICIWLLVRKRLLSFISIPSSSVC